VKLDSDVRTPRMIFAMQSVLDRNIPDGCTDFEEEFGWELFTEMQKDSVGHTI